MTATDTTVRLPPDLVEQCESRIDDTEFESVEEYARFVLRAVVDDGTSADPDGDALDEDDESVSEDVADRLASLGYR